MAAKAGSEHTAPADAADAVAVNGNGKLSHPPVSEHAADDLPRENIFLFWPNIIGTSTTATLSSLRLCQCLAQANHWG